jgi:hypothetical protein
MVGELFQQIINFDSLISHHALSLSMRIHGQGFLGGLLGGLTAQSIRISATRAMIATVMQLAVP